MDGGTSLATAKHVSVVIIETCFFACAYANQCSGDKCRTAYGVTVSLCEASQRVVPILHLTRFRAWRDSCQGGVG